MEIHELAGTPWAGSLIDRAKKAAIKAHAGQKRKYTGENYDVHPESVAMRAFDMGFEDHVVAAGWLHDADEDTQYKIADVRRDFGDKVADLVAWLTNPSKGSRLPRAQRKAMDRTHIENAPAEAKALKALDRLDNLSSMSQAEPDFRELYARESLLLADAISKNTESQLILILAESVREAAENLLEQP